MLAALPGDGVQALSADTFFISIVPPKAQLIETAPVRIRKGADRLKILLLEAQSGTRLRQRPLAIPFSAPAQSAASVMRCKTDCRSGIGLFTCRCHACRLRAQRMRNVQRRSRGMEETTTTSLFKYSCHDQIATLMLNR